MKAVFEDREGVGEKGGESFTPFPLPDVLNSFSLQVLPVRPSFPILGSIKPSEPIVWRFLNSEETPTFVLIHLAIGQ